MKSINTKLTIVFLLLILIPLVITITIIMTSMEKGFSSLTNTQQDEMIHIVETEIDAVASELQTLTERYATDATFIEALQSGDRDVLAESVALIYPRLKDEHHLSAFEFGDLNGVVLLRGHNPAEYGDDKKDIPAIQLALNGESIAGFEFGKSGLSVRAFVPIIANGQIIATLQTSIDAGFIEQLSSTLQGVAISLHDIDGEVMFSSHQDNSQSIEATTMQQIANGESVAMESEQHLQSLLPIQDPTGNELIGAISITKDLSQIQATQQQIRLIAMIISVITFISVVVIAIFISRSISLPVIKISKAMDELATGKLTVEVPIRQSEDEIGQLTNAVQTMKTNFQQIIAQVTEASNSVAAQSEQLNVSSHDMHAGSEQISATVQEISASSDNQAQSIGEMAETMTHFTETIQQTNQKGQQIHIDAQNVLSLTNEGQQAMIASNGQMVKINRIMDEAVMKMNHLDQKATEISSLVAIIQEIADQTNLLALNASIEAARAGEHGKGFAVVADEVRKLSEQVARSVTDITHIVSAIQHETTSVEASLKAGYTEVQHGTTQIESTSSAFEHINTSVMRMVSTIEDISATLSSNANSAKQMNTTIDQMAAISEETAAAVEETSATTNQFHFLVEEVTDSTKQLATLADELHMLVKHFKV